MVIALDQHDVGANPSRSDRGSRAGRAAADYEHVGFSENRSFTRGLKNGFGGAGRPRPAAAGKQFNTLRGTDAAAVISAARRLAENFALPRRS